MPQSIGEALLVLNAGVFSVQAISAATQAISASMTLAMTALAAFQIHGALGQHLR
jgi:hypothetical protein